MNRKHFKFEAGKVVIRSPDGSCMEVENLKFESGDEPELKSGRKVEKQRVNLKKSLLILALICIKLTAYLS